MRKTQEIIKGLFHRKKRSFIKTTKAPKHSYTIFAGAGLVDLRGKTMPVHTAETVNAAIMDFSGTECRPADVKWKVSASLSGNIAIHIYPPRIIEVRA